MCIYVLCGACVFVLWLLWILVQQVLISISRGWWYLSMCWVKEIPFLTVTVPRLLKTKSKVLFWYCDSIVVNHQMILLLLSSLLCNNRVSNWSFRPFKVIYFQSWLLENWKISNFTLKERAKKLQKYHGLKYKLFFWLNNIFF